MHARIHARRLRSSASMYDIFLTKRKKRKNANARAFYESGDSAERAHSFRSCRAHWLEIEFVYPLIRGTKSPSMRRHNEDGENGRRSGRDREVETRARCGRHAASRPTSHPADPIFFKRPAHSSWPDSLTIIKRKSFYSAVSFRLRSYFLPPVSTSSFFPLFPFSVLPPASHSFPFFLFPHCAFAPLCAFSLFLSRFSTLPFLSIGSSSPSRDPILFPALSAGYFIIQLLSFAWQKAPLPTTCRTGEEEEEEEGGERASRGKGWKSYPLN